LGGLVQQSTPSSALSATFAEAEANYYAALENLDMAADQLKLPPENPTLQGMSIAMRWQAMHCPMTQQRGTACAGASLPAKLHQAPLPTEICSPDP
jgi:hypothetical protein